MAERPCRLRRPCLERGRLQLGPHEHCYAIVIHESHGKSEHATSSDTIRLADPQREPIPNVHAHAR